MPEMTVLVRWPDGQEQDCWSPSLVMHDHLAEGASYTVTDFTARATHALDIGSDRVRAKFGFACTAAAETAARITRRAAGFGPDEVVQVLRMHPPAPDDERTPR